MRRREMWMVLALLHIDGTTPTEEEGKLKSEGTPR
jgi:hypothetical protein